MEEVFKPIEGFEGIYQISNLGRLLSMERKLPDRVIGEKFLKYRTNYKGYICVDLWDGTRNRKKLVHRLMAQAFVPNNDPKNKIAVNHKNGIRTHNVVDLNDIEGDGTNLEWVTPDFNTRDRNERQREFKAMRLAEKGLKIDAESNSKKDKKENKKESIWDKKYTLKDLFK